MTKTPAARLGRSWSRAAGAALLAALLAGSACRFDRAERWLGVGEGAACTPGESRCTDAFERCVSVGGGATWRVEDDCGARGLSCISELGRCAACRPAVRSCSVAGHVVVCRADGGGEDLVQTCDLEGGSACRGDKCLSLCADANLTKSNVGCEYWAADLDNARSHQ